MLGWGLLTAGALSAQPAFNSQGTEYSLSRGLLGDQTHPGISIGRDGGFVVWQDNAIDGQGLGIGAAALDNYLSPVPIRFFLVNETAAGDQENPAVQRLQNGGALFVWQGGPTGRQHIYGRVLGPDGWATGEFAVSSYAAGQQADPALTLLADGNVLAIWSSFGQDGSMQGIYGQVLAPNGSKVGAEFRANQATLYNQRTPAVSALEAGGFVVAWVSEQQRYMNSVDIYARLYDAAGAPKGGEFRVNATTNVCANPVVCGTLGGSFLVAWSQASLTNLADHWDVVAAGFDATGRLARPEVRVNAYTPRSQYRPQVAAVGSHALVVWTSDWQDGSWEGVYARYLSAGGELEGDEFRVNSTTVSQQIHPTVASDSERRFVVAWSSFVGGAPGFEILGQRYASDEALPQPAPPLVSALDSYSLLISWPPLAGYSDLVGYRLYVDDSTVGRSVGNNFLVLTDLLPGSTHTVRLGYELSGGRASPLSAAASGQTWGRDRTFDGLPDDWQEKYWGSDSKKWPAASVDSDGDGASNLDEFLAGTDPTDASSVLRVTVRSTVGGMLVRWNARPGSIYQLQSSGDLKTWSDLGTAQLAVGNAGATVIAPADAATYYRVIRIR